MSPLPGGRRHCGPMHASSRSGEAPLLTKGEPLYRVYLFYLVSIADAPISQ